MGNQVSSPEKNDKNIFEKELQHINDIVNSIVTEKDLFKNRDYNFLTQDVCNQHYILMENELNRHLKVELNNLGTSLYLIPKDNESYYKRYNLNKKEICKKISNHYIKILYILCLIKYVYNLEQYGDFSISGIIFRNVRFVDNIMEINFCNVPQKDFSKTMKDAYRLDFGQLEGLKFLTSFFLEKSEAHSFIKVMRTILSRKTKSKIGEDVCGYILDTNASLDHVKTLEKLYMNKFDEKLVCNARMFNDPPSMNKIPNLHMYVEKDNPIFSKEYCSEIHKLIIQLNTPGGKKVLEKYKMMKQNYLDNIKEIEKLVDLLIVKSSDGSYSLRDISKDALDSIIYNVKDVIKTYYIQSLLDFQKLIEVGKKTPNINMIK